MSTTISLLIQAIDRATGVVRNVADETSGAMEQVKKASENVAQAHSLSWKETKNLITSFSGLATSAFSLYQSIDRVQDAQINLSRANLLVQQATNAVEDAQRRYNAVVEKYGADSEQSQAALKDLQLAQERYNYAVERANLVQNNYNELIVQTAIGFIPSLITSIDSGIKAFQAAQGAISAVSGALNFLAANPIMLVIAAVAALVTGLIYLYNTNEDFRNAVNALGAALQNFLKPIIDWLIGAFNVLKGAVEAVARPISDFVNGVKGAFASAGNAIQNFISSICFAHAIAEAVDSAERDLNRFVNAVDESMSRAYGEIRRFGVDFGNFRMSAPVPVPAAASTSIQFNAPLVNVEGSADRRTAELAAEMVRERLKTVVIEATSRSAPTKRVVLPKVM